jgi:hypothetical protein
MHVYKDSKDAKVNSNLVVFKSKIFKVISINYLRSISMNFRSNRQLNRILKQITIEPIKDSKEISKPNNKTNKF